MNNAIVAQRQTKYCQAIESLLASMRHATNNQLLVELHKTYPNLSATTVHRATARLAMRKSIAVAPPSRDGSIRYDTNTIPHDHFLCTSCGVLRDTDVKDKVIPILESSIGDCHISGRLTISGLCKQCKENIL
ncbi:transcriptional repressor [Candidatus Saccharibacteria bacterium]|jgi:Fe2+ or Zn2+ uptake regulation protein|nr:transcriptional repressor [Candidatus Saccharibacteria bacterium]